MGRKRLGELLVEQGAITAEQLQAGLSLQRQSGNRLGAALVAQGLLSEERLVQALAVALGLEVVDLDALELEWGALHALRDRFCEANDLFPVALEAGKGGKKSLVVAMADPLNLPAIEEIEFTTGYKVTPRLAPLSKVRAAIRRHYLKLPAEGRTTRPPGPPMLLPDPAKAAPAAAPAPKPEPRAAEEEPVLLADAVEEPPPLPSHEKTARTALADLIREREQRATQRLQRPAQGGGAPAYVADLEYLLGEPLRASDPNERLERLERHFWALLRLVAKKGVLTREEFLAEFEDE